MKPIHLFVWNNADQLAFNWSEGKVFTSAYQVVAAHQGIDNALKELDDGFFLFWDAKFGQPNSALIIELSRSNADVWHAGLRLGLAGKPEEMDYIKPTWSLNRDPDSSITAMSWRISLRACLCRIRVLQQLGQIDAIFEDMASASLEMGLRYVWRGVVLLHEPRLIPVGLAQNSVDIPLNDRYRLIARHHRPVWQKYVLFRRILATRKLRSELRAFRQSQNDIKSTLLLDQTGRYLERSEEISMPLSKQTISVLIPTLHRYSYLKSTLEQLENQSIRPLEVVCVDQTPEADRQPNLYAQYPDLQLKVIWRDKPGQCSARNVGLSELRGDLVLFLDDDVGIPPDYIEKLLSALNLYNADIVEGVWTQGEAEALSTVDRHYRMSDRFAGGNSLVRREIIEKTGGFDLNYNRNYGADADFGMRMYLRGAVSVITPHAHEYSYSPPTGGLQSFGVYNQKRKIKLLQPWPAETRVYFWMQYFSARQLRETLFLELFQTAVPWNARYSASPLQKIGFILNSMWTLPLRSLGLWRSLSWARKTLEQGPQIPCISLQRMNK